MFLPKTPFSESNHFGMAVSSNGVKVMVVDESKQVISQASATYQSPILDGENIIQEPLLAAILQAKQEANIEQKYAAVVIPEKFAYSRAHTFPDLNHQEIDEAIGWQIEKIFPFARNEVYADWKLIQREDNKTQVMITVIPKGLLDQLKSTLQAAGVFPISFEPSTSALSRVISKENVQHLIVVEIDTSFVSASLMVDGVSILTTTSHYQSDQADATLLQHIQGLIDSLKIHMQKIQLVADNINIVITGENASDSIANTMQQTFNTDTKVLDLENSSPADHLAYIAASTDILPPQSDNSINLLPTTLQEYYRAHMSYTLSKRVVKLTGIFACIALLIIGVIFVVISYSKINAQRQLAQARTNAPTVGASEFNLAEVNKNAQRLTSLFSRKTSPEEYINTLLDNIPEGITLSYITYSADAQSLQIIGTAPNRDALLNLRDTIAETQIFSRPQLPLAALEDVQNQEFSITLDIQKNAQ